MLLGGGVIWVVDRANPAPHPPAVQAAEWRPKTIATDLPPGELGQRIEYGYALITRTAEQIGPLAPDSSRRYAGNYLTCGNCHLGGGTKIGSGSFVGVAKRFPQFRGRENKIGTLAERINGCMERSMNGIALPEESAEMEAMIAYMTWLSEGVPEGVEPVYRGYVRIEIPEAKADPAAGKALYTQLCQACHQEGALGLKAPGEPFAGYIYPPLAGTDTYNNGAGMTRVLTAAEFIKGNMPLGATVDRPLLTDLQAYNIAAYINSLERPMKRNLEADFPDRKLKPVSTPYGPWADTFSVEQHTYGPFPPIIAYYKEAYGLEKAR